MANTKDSQDFWYPSKLTVLANDIEQNPIVTIRFAVQSLELHRSRDISSFTPKIEDGTTIMDGIKGTSFVYGKRASPRVRSLVSQRIQESKQKLANQQESTERQNASPSDRNADAFPLIAILCGAIGLIFAVYVTIRRHFT